MGNNLAKIIKDAREAKNISQRELARQTGIDNNTISQIEKGERKKPNSLSLQKLSQALDLDFGLLMLESGYTQEDINIIDPNNNSIYRRVLSEEDMLKEAEDKIKQINNLINSIKESKRTHSDPAYKNMSKEDIAFFDKQSDELIEANRLMLDIYKKKAKFLKTMISRKNN